LTDAKEWVSIKIPESIRDDAREASGTYGEIMQAGLEGERPVERNDKIDVDELAERIADRVETNGGVGPEQIAREVSKQLDYVELADRVAHELEERMA